jgi:repressor LexA
LLKVLTKTNKRGMLTAEPRRTVSKEGRTMSFGEQLRKRREELGISRAELADRLGVSRSAIGNYETGVSAPKEEVLLRLFDALGVDPNYLYRDAYRANGGIRSDEEQALLESYRRLSLAGRQTVHTMVRALEGMQQELEQAQPQQAPRTIPLYFSPAAAGYAAPVFSEDYETIPVTGQVPRGAELAVRIQGDSMEPHIHDGGVVYVNHDPLQNGDVGIFCVDGEMVCKQYYRDPLGMVYLFSLNRRRADADVLLPPSSGRSLTCFGRCMLHSLPLPQ